MKQDKELNIKLANSILKAVTNYINNTLSRDTFFEPIPEKNLLRTALMLEIPYRGCVISASYNNLYSEFRVYCYVQDIYDSNSGTYRKISFYKFFSDPTTIPSCLFIAKRLIDEMYAVYRRDSGPVWRY